MLTKTVQVIVTCYNHEKYIEQCLVSIFKQTYQHIFLAVYNDGSSDASSNVIRETLENSPFEQTNYHYHANQGLVKTRNLALGTYLGQADYLLFVDSDNFLEPNYIEAMVDIAEQGADIVYADLINPEDGELVVKAREFDLKEFYTGNFIDSCSLVRQDVIADCRYDDYLNSLEDYDFFFQLIINRGAVARPCFKTFLNYRLLDGSVNDKGNFKKYYQNYFHIWGKYCSDYPEWANEALQLNIDGFYETLNLDGLYSREKITAIFATRQVNQAKEKRLVFALKKADTLSLYKPPGYDLLRLDLSELPSYYTSIHLFDVANQVELLPISGNAIKRGQSYFFNAPDPQLYYELTEHSSQELQLTYQQANISAVMEEDFLPKQLTLQLVDTEAELAELETLYKDLVNRYGVLEHQYNSVINSRRWTIPSRIIDFFKRKE